MRKEHRRRPDDFILAAFHAVTSVVAKSLRRLAVFHHQRQRNRRLRRGKVSDVFFDTIDKDREAVLLEIHRRLAGFFVVNHSVNIDQVGSNADLLGILRFAYQLRRQRLLLLFLLISLLGWAFVLFLI